MFSAVAGLPMAARPAVDDFVSKSSLFALICRIYPDQAGSSLDSYLSGLACVLKSIESHIFHHCDIASLTEWPCRH